MNKLCRVCSSAGEYDIFSRIPIYLHENSSQNEFLEWNKTIAEYLEEATGLEVSRDDGFPDKMCALCISYLKHATTFRQQVITNMINLKTAQIIDENSDSSDKESVLVTSDDLEFSDRRKTEAQKLLNRKVNGGASNYITIPWNYENHYSTKKRDNFYRDDDAFTGSSDDNEIEPTENKTKSYFNYEETNFEEDDIMDDMKQESRIVVNVPEYFKERKCRACSRRFMFEESYNEHLGVCIEYKFLVFLEESNRLFDIRKSKSCSPHEFIRRMIFNLKKICNWLRIFCGENILLSGSDGLKKPSFNSDDKSSEVSSGENCVTVVEKKAVPQNTSDTLIDLLRKSAEGDASLIRNFNKTPDPLLERLKHNSSEMLFRTSTPEENVKSKRTLFKNFKRITSSSDNGEEENFYVIEPITKKAQVLPVMTTEPFAPAYPNIVFSAQCNQCNTKFSSIEELEIHNSKFHNKISYDNVENHRKIIAMFEDDEDATNGGCSKTSKMDGLVNLF